MTPEKRREQRRNEDANFRLCAARENERLQARISALESLLAESRSKLIEMNNYIEGSVGHIHL